MHLCPYCNKLGISTYAAIADPFSRGLASCRYCHNVAKSKARFGSYLIGPILVFAAWAMHFFNPPGPVVIFLFVVVGFTGLVIADRLIDFERDDQANGTHDRTGASNND